MNASMIALLVALSVVAVPVPATAGPVTVTLPAPTGPHPVGREDLHLVDRDRVDPWVPDGPRELMVSVWYPAAAARGPRVTYASPAESSLFVDLFEVEGAAPDALTRVRAHARTGAPPLRAAGPLPLVLLSPGFGTPRWLQTALAEDLASRGYVVAGVDHTYEAAAITFPDGRVTECVLCARDDKNWATIVASRAGDLSFVLDRLLASPARWPIDARRVAAAGHSLGGAAAAAVMLDDPRVDAGINMDGTFHHDVTRTMDRPFLLFGAAAHGDPAADPSWPLTWTQLGGWRRWLNVPLMEHFSFSDAATFGPLIGEEVQPLDGTRVIDLIRRYDRAFFDLHLRGRPQSLFDGPSPRHPEVDFVTGAS
ncbi:alpha/beta hydrolase family protein [Catenuloplanes atrovinosus]|uniref:Dienelactone hydrolase n=1 Tax=Catenuloplanes atrovinosus TaxID=137266 RepID=A0AAE4CCF6_9ACTN|nr:hypothetical protein [Catenuloplanes atrovinosus]MDR7276465.1 putative dienelactone hydrolase [Catenuloplanes atrovinosus]